jgi:hypothetical protein
MKIRQKNSKIEPLGNDKNKFRIVYPDKSETQIWAPSQNEMLNWINLLIKCSTIRVSTGPVAVTRFKKRTQPTTLADSFVSKNRTLGIMDMELEKEKPNILKSSNGTMPRAKYIPEITPRLSHLSSGN